MINSLYSAASAVKQKSMFSTAEFKKILEEATSNENWNISNSKLQVLADHTYNWEDYTVIMKHLWKKVQCKPKEWRRIFKALNTMDYLVKNGAPRVVQEIKDDLYKIRSLQDFCYQESGTDRGQGVRDKSRELCELLSDPIMLQNEREFARQTRDKLQGTIGNQSSMGMGPAGSNIPQSMGSNQLGGSAGPSSGNKYGGFGSEDIARLGYNQENKFNAPYDPYTKGQSATGIGTYQHNNEKNKELKKKKSETKKKSKKTKKKKSKKDESSSDSDVTSSSDENSDESSSEESAEEKKETAKERRKRKAKAEKKKGLAEVPKSQRQIGGVSVTESQGTNVVQSQPNQQAQPAQQNELIDIFNTNPSTAANPQSQQQQQQQTSGFPFMQQQQPQPQQQQNNNMFSGLQMAQQQQPQVQQQNNMFNGMNMNNQQPQQQMQQPNQQPQQNMFGLNMAQQQPQQTQAQQTTSMFNGLNLGNQQQQQAQPQAFGFMNQQPTQPQQQPTQQPPTSDPFAIQPTQQQPQATQQNQNMFSGLQTSQQASTEPQPDPAPSEDQLKVKKQYSQHKGLFNFDTMKEEQHKIFEKKAEVEAQKPKGQINLLESNKNDNLDNLQLNFGMGQPNAFQTSQNPSFGMMQGNQGFQGQTGGQQFKPMGVGGFQPQMPNQQMASGFQPQINMQNPNMSAFNQNQMGVSGMQQMPNQQMGFNPAMMGVMGQQQQQQPMFPGQQPQFNPQQPSGMMPQMNPQQQNQSNFGFMR